MSAAAEVCLSSFARDVDAGLSDPVQKYLPARCFYDALGSTLFEAITLLPEYVLTRADERLLRQHSGDIAQHGVDLAPAALHHLALDLGEHLNYEVLRWHWRVAEELGHRAGGRHDCHRGRSGPCATSVARAVSLAALFTFASQPAFDLSQLRDDTTPQAANQQAAKR